jgi:hypothetical protein
VDKAEAQSDRPDKRQERHVVLYLEKLEMHMVRFKVGDTVWAAREWHKEIRVGEAKVIRASLKSKTLDIGYATKDQNAFAFGTLVQFDEVFASKRLALEALAKQLTSIAADLRVEANWLVDLADHAMRLADKETSR